MLYIFLETQSKVLTLSWMTCHTNNLPFLRIFTFHNKKKEKPLEEGLTKQPKKETTRKAFDWTRTPKANILFTKNKANSVFFFGKKLTFIK